MFFGFTVYDLACAVQPSNNLKTNDFCREYGNLTQKFAFGVSNFKTFLELFATSMGVTLNNQCCYQGLKT